MWFTSSKDSKPASSESAKPSDDGLGEFSKALSEAYNSKSSSPVSGSTSTNDDVETDKIKTKRQIGAKKVEGLPLDKFPKEMSCVTAINEVLECMSLGGQIRHYYRYGDFTMCERQNEKVNFCFKNSLNTGEVKEKNIQEYNKKRMIEDMKRGSSEDIWESKI